MVAFFRRVADGCAFGCFLGDFDSFVVDRAFDQHACRRVTGLSCIVEAVTCPSLYRALDIRIREDDVRALAAELQRDAFDRICRSLGDGYPGSGRTSETHHIDTRMTAHRFAYARTVSVYEIKNAGRESGRIDEFRKQHGGHWCDLRRLQHDRTRRT